MNVTQLDLESAFCYRCGLTAKNFGKIFAQRPLVPEDATVVQIPTSKTTRKVLPPRLTAAQQRRLDQLLRDDSVPLIAFPLLLLSKNKKCADKQTRDRHLVVAVLSKATGVVELFDDKLPSSIQYFGTNFLINAKGSFATYMLPKLQTIMATTLQESVPRFHERQYRAILDSLVGAGYAADNYTAHAAWTANYLQERAADAAASLAILRDRVAKRTAATFLTTYETLRRTSVQKCGDAKLINPMTGRCVAADGRVGHEIQGIPPRRRRGATVVNLHEHFVDSDASSHYLEKWEIGANTAQVMRYLMNKYKDIAVLDTKEFEWDGTNLRPPRDFNKVWRDGLTTPTVRYIAFSVYLKIETIIEAHQNTLIYDKETRELELFEPNGGDYKAFNNDALNVAIERFFEGRIGTYVPPMLACPRAFQQADNNEHNWGVKDIGGNCAVWGLYYLELRLSNPALTRKEVIDKAFAEIQRRGSFALFINGYHRHIELAIRRAKKDLKK
jgi:hypothetical protein